MTIPKHKNPREDKVAWAPYNFVPLPEAVVPAEGLPERDRYFQDRHTGVIHCQLTTKTPLYTRAALEEGEYGSIEAKDKAQFFYVDPETQKPVIPGSSLRGAIRNLVEIASYSKIQPVTDKQLFFRTLDNSTVGKAYGRRMTGGNRDKEGSYPNVSAGYMERRGYDFFVRPAQVLEGTQYYRVEESVAMQAIRGLKPMARRNERTGKYGPNRQYRWRRQTIWFKPVPPTSHKPESAQFYADVTEISTQPKSVSEGWQKGVFIVSGWVPSKGAGKHLHWIIGPPDEDDDALVTVEQIDADAYSEAGAGLSQTINRTGWSVLPKPGEEPIPCFYNHWQDSEGRDRIAFGHTAMFRLPYENSPRDLLSAHLKDSDVTDMAEAIFGWVDERKGRQIAGRVYFGDAHVESAENGLWVLREDEAPVRSLLSGPKPTTFQHYLTQPTDVKDNLLTYDDEGKTTLRGHKLYWHKNPELSRKDYEDRTASDTQVTFLRPVREGVTFSCDIRFENLTDVELGALLWVLQQCSLDNQHLKIGMGKPRGLGTVRLKPSLYVSKRKTRYRQLKAEWLAEEGNVPSDNMTSFVKKFEEYIWSQMPEEVREDAHSYRSLKRVRSLQTMLRWPGPDSTKYMELADFRDRKVLPDPLEYWNKNEPVEDSPPPDDDGPSPEDLRNAILARLYASEG